MLLVLALLAWPGSGWAGSLRFWGEMVQGGLIRGIAAPGAIVTLNGSLVRVAEDGRFVFGLGHDSEPWALVKAQFPDGSRQRLVLKIRQRDYPEQHVDGLAPAQVTPPEEVRARIRAEAAQIAAARAGDSDLGDALEAFVWPALGPITGVFGSRRVLNGTPRAPHFGVDVAAGEGAEVVAVAGGIVRLADALYFSGNTVVIDHGHGLSSSYLHLSEMSVALGDEVAQGMRIGRIGATGRATGPHLDWRVNWFDARLDPALVAGPMPEPPPTD